MRKDIEKVIAEFESRRELASEMIRSDSRLLRHEGMGRLAETNHILGKLKEVLKADDGGHTGNPTEPERDDQRQQTE